MVKSISVHHNGITYRTKKMFTEYCNDLIYNKIGLCDSVRGKSEDLFYELNELLQRHPDYERKTKNMKDIKIVRNVMNKAGLETRIIYNNNTHDMDISWCIAREGKKPTIQHQLTQSMRTAIRFQIYNYKQNNKPICEFCNEYGNHCDHIIHFQKLKEDFLNDYTGTLPSEFTQLNDGSNQTCFIHSDFDFEEKWKKYHNDHAKLRMLCQKCNITREKYCSIINGQV